MENASKRFRKRDAILACLNQSKAHPSAEAIFHSLQAEHSDISLATVYRNLALFREQGQIISLGTVNGIERFDGCTEPHSHFVCRCCGAILDISQADLPESISQGVSRELSCRVEKVSLMLTGICSPCLVNQK